jgi:hypothetical protein
MRVNKYLITSGINDLLDLLNVFFSLAFVIIHIIDLYFRFNNEQL